MKTISYIPSNDELIVKFRPVRKKPTKEVGRFKIWWDDEGNICAIDIMPFTEELADFEKNLETVRFPKIHPLIECLNEMADSMISLEQVRREMSSIKGNFSDIIIQQRRERG